MLRLVCWGTGQIYNLDKQHSVGDADLCLAGTAEIPLAGRTASRSFVLLLLLLLFKLLLFKLLLFKLLLLLLRVCTFVR